MIQRTAKHCKNSISYVVFFGGGLFSHSLLRNRLPSFFGFSPKSKKATESLSSICAHSATTIGAASASGITSKHRAWNPTLLALPYEFFALAHEPGRISEPAHALLDNLINRLPPNDRARLRTYSYQLIAATITLGIIPPTVTKSPLYHGWNRGNFFERLE